jgi:transcriptional regulator with XRE-family HTH domain
MRKVVPIPFPSEPLVADSAVFGRAVRAARTSAGMTLADAAVTLGVSKQTLADLETAKASVGLGTALRIAHELGVAVFVAPSGEREVVRRAIVTSPPPTLIATVGHPTATASPPAPPVKKGRS